MHVKVTQAFQVVSPNGNVVDPHIGVICYNYKNTKI